MNFVAGQRTMCDVKDLFNPLERQARDHEVPRELRRPGSLAASIHLVRVVPICTMRERAAWRQRRKGAIISQPEVAVSSITKTI